MSGPATGRQRATGIAAVVAALAFVVVGVGVLEANEPVPAPAPEPSGSPPPVASDDRPALAVDGEISDADLYHDSRDDLYRVPYGAVPAETEVTLRLRAAAGDLSEATVRVWDSFEELQALVPMEVVATDPTQGEHGYDYWEATLRTSTRPTVLYYRFIVRDGPTTRYIEDDPAADGGAVPEGNDGGPGVARTTSPDSPWQIDVYEPDFTTPAWTRGAVVYQIFPDRFFNGDPSNDPSPDAEQGEEGAALYRYGDVYGNDVLRKEWDDLPEGYCRAYQGVSCAEEPLGRDFFGGDLAGITAKLDDLEALGVTALSLNPIFAAPSNHRYDTSSYDLIDPDLGTQADFETLPGRPTPAASGCCWTVPSTTSRPTRRGSTVSNVRGYRGVRGRRLAVPRLVHVPPTSREPAVALRAVHRGRERYLLPGLVRVRNDPRSDRGQRGRRPVRRSRWGRPAVGRGRYGRLAVDGMDDLTHGFMRQIRDAVKATDPDALVLGDQGLDSSPWLLGDKANSTMNHRFRRAVIGLINGERPTSTGRRRPLAQPVCLPHGGPHGGLSEARIRCPAEPRRQPRHDAHPWTLTPGRDDPALKESEENLSDGKAKLRQLAALQLTWPGMASIYYGTEAGLTGHDDPDNRRPYPWDAIDEDSRRGTGRWDRSGATMSRCARATCSSSTPTTRSARSRSCGGPTRKPVSRC